MKMSPCDRKRILAEQVEQAQRGIGASARVISEMLTARACADCPEWAENDSLVEGLLEAIQRLSDSSHDDILALVDWIENSPKKKEAA